MGNKILRLKDVAKIFEVKEVTIRHWCNYDGLKCTRTIGGHRRFKSEDIESFMESKGVDKENISVDGLKLLK